MVLRCLMTHTPDVLGQHIVNQTPNDSLSILEFSVTRSGEKAAKDRCIGTNTFGPARTTVEGMSSVLVRVPPTVNRPEGHGELPVAQAGYAGRDIERAVERG